MDYHALRAIQTVIDQQSFEAASKVLSISQSAVTQRIQNFESYLGQKLLVRTTPYKPTLAGESYLSLLRKVTTLEEEILISEQLKPTIKLAINRDSLDLYFQQILLDSKISERMSLEIIADDQEKTLKYLKNGSVDMCISSQKKNLPKHTSQWIGEMKYTLVCSKKFYNMYFSNGVNKQSLSKAPLVIFDKYDKVQHLYLKEHYNIENFSHINLMPSVVSFKSAVLGGFGYGLLPLIDIKKELKQKKLLQITPTKDLSIPLYLHQWEYQRECTRILSERIFDAAKELI